MGLTLNPTTYGDLCAKVLPRVIENDQQLKRMIKALEDLTFQSSATPEERALARLLEKLISDYEDEQAPVPDASPTEVLRFLMDQHGLRQADLLDIFGSRSVASAVCNGNRAISKAQAKKLAVRFNVSADVFI
ncbi:MAG: transcriptional regulator [Bryobacterales bacterium]|nr:transcriptional regulator [Bryobacterales bacterium]